MRLRQYVMFQVWSKALDPAQLTSRIGIEPDEVRVMGSKHQLPKPVPRSHWWIVRSDARKVRAVVQVDDVMARVTPARDALHELIAGGEAQARLQVVRYFGEDDGDEEAGFATGPDGATIRESVDLFGWWLDREVLEFLVYVGAEVEVDEYDMQQNEANFGQPDEY